MRAFPRQLVLGHRGAPLDAPENTLESFDRAIRQGADGVELDVRLTADGVPVIIHDACMAAGTPGADQGGPRVRDLAWPAVQRLSAARVPSLEQAAAWAAAAGVWLNVELKETGTAARVLHVLRDHALLDRTFVSSFIPAALEPVRRRQSAVRVYLLSETWTPTLLGQAAALSAEGICLRDDAAGAGALEALARAGLASVVWTVNRPERIEELLRAGVDAVITDVPATAVAIRDRLRRGA